MPAVPSLPVKLSGADSLGGSVLFADFREFCEALTSCLRVVENVVSRKSKIRYLISDMRTGSPLTMTLAPLPPRKGQDVREEVLGLFVETVGGLEEGGVIDPRFTKEDLRTFRRLAEPLGRRLAGVEIASRRITTNFLANVDVLIGASIPSEGSVSGRLERLNLHEKKEFALYPPIEGFVVVCVFPDELTDKVIAAINRTVTVHGRLIFRPDSPFPERVQVRSLEIHPSDDELPRLSELRGLLRGGIGNQTAVEFLNTIRDE
jgi:hypothetical protein